MNGSEAEKLVQTLSEYYGRKLTENPILLTVWMELFIPLDVASGTELTMMCIEAHQFLPSPKILKEEYALKKGSNYRAELSQAIAIYCRNNQREIRRIPSEISTAITKAGGVNRFKNATEQQWEKMERDYLAFRTQAEQQKRMILLASNDMKTLGVSHESN